MSDIQTPPIDTPGPDPLDPASYPTEFPRVCVTCKEKNLTEDLHFIECLRCSSLYCFHFASGVDPQYCQECCIDVQMLEQTVVKKSEHYNEETDKTYVRTSRARQLSFTGLDWLFFNRKIHTITDTELSLAIEYHQAIYQSMMYEREKRRVEHFHRNAGKQMPVRISTGTVQDSTTITTKVRKTRTVKPVLSTSAEVNLKSVLEQLLKSGMTPAQIQTMFGAKK